MFIYPSISLCIFKQIIDMKPIPVGSGVVAWWQRGGGGTGPPVTIF